MESHGTAVETPGSESLEWELSGHRIIMFSDICNSHSLRVRDPAAAARLIARHNEVVTGVVEEQRNHARVVKYIGDGLMVALHKDADENFLLTEAALSCAWRILERLTADDAIWNAELVPGIGLPAIALSAGDVQATRYPVAAALDPSNVDGLPVHIAEALLRMASPGQILFDNSISDSCGAAITVDQKSLEIGKHGEMDVPGLPEKILVAQLMNPGSPPPIRNPVQERRRLLELADSASSAVHQLDAWLCLPDFSDFGRSNVVQFLDVISKADQRAGALSAVFDAPIATVDELSEKIADSKAALQGFKTYLENQLQVEWLRTTPFHNEVFQQMRFHARNLKETLKLVGQAAHDELRKREKELLR